MASLQIRELPDDVYSALTERAKREGRSLAQQAAVELRRIPEFEARALRERVLRAVRERAPDLGPTAPDPTDLVRRDREA